MHIFDHEFNVSTDSRNQMVDITSRLQDFVVDSGISSGYAIIFCPHTTAAITINENADSDVQHDVLMTMEQLMPHIRPGYRHCEGNSDAHCKSSLFGCSQQLIISKGRLWLGTWQGVYFCEFDGPRNRQVYVQVRGR